jgi:uncharacterized protein (TIGR03118 family)
MLKRLRSPRSLALLVAATSGLAIASPAVAFAGTAHDEPQHGGSQHQDHGPQDHGGDHRDPTVQQTNLVSDIPGRAKLTDPDLVNPWGLALRPEGSTIWTANQGTDSSTLYSLPPGTDHIAKSPTSRVTMPGSVAGPAGQVANLGDGFVLANGTQMAPAHFIFATLDGNIEAWSPTVDPATGDAELKASVPGAAYSGLALASSKHGDQLYAANVTQDRIDVFNSAFKQVKTASWQFTDPHLPKGYHPFNAQTLNGNIFVTYDTTDATTGREGIGKGIGVVDEYDPEGHLLHRIATGGDLNAPWGLAIAPPSWDLPAGSLLVGNFGDGRINIIAKDHGRFQSRIQGQIRTSAGKVFAEPGLWALTPGTATTGGKGSLFFSAGLNNEQNGLLGILRGH